MDGVDQEAGLKVYCLFSDFDLCLNAVFDSVMKSTVVNVVCTISYSRHLCRWAR